MQVPVERNINDDPKLREIIEYWKPWLGISDWAIRLEVKSQINVANEGLAASQSNLERRLATIELAHSDTRWEGCREDDSEQSIVHELLHIVFAAWHDRTREVTSVEKAVCFEQPIDQLAETLVRMRRSSGHTFQFEMQF